ncbi:MAG: helix-turn-helix transcriptional regulator [Filifactoraceae bacterium]
MCHTIYINNEHLGGVIIQLTQRQEKIIEIVKEFQPITGESIAAKLELTRATLRPDLTILTMSGILDARPKVGYYFGKSSSAIGQISKIKERSVESVMSLPVVIKETDTIYSAIITMFMEDTGSIFIVSEGELSGIISRKDLLKSAVGGLDIHDTPVSLAMTRMPNVVYVEEHELIPIAVQRLLVHEVDSLPVVRKEIINDKEHLKIVGRFTKTNVTRIFIDIITG